MLCPLSYGRTLPGLTGADIPSREPAPLGRRIGGVSEGIRTLDLQGHNLAP